MEDEQLAQLVKALTAQKSKKKFSERLTVALPHGLAFGFIMWLLTYFIATAMNITAGQTTVNTIGLSLGSFGLGFSLPVAYSLAKDMEE